MARVLLKVDFIRIFLLKVCETHNEAIHIPSQFKIKRFFLSIFQRRNTMFIRKTDDSSGVVFDRDVDIINFLCCGRVYCLLSLFHHLTPRT